MSDDLIDLIEKMRDAAYLAFEDGTNDYTTAPEAADALEAQAARIERLDARIVELKAEAKLWWDENFKKQTACEQMGKRIAELEAALRNLSFAAFSRENVYDPCSLLEVKWKLDHARKQADSLLKENHE